MLVSLERDTTASEEKSSRSYWGFVLWPVAVIVLYVLSIGPVLFATDRGIISHNVLNFYKPLVLVVNGTPLRKPFRMYQRLWLPNVLSFWWNGVEFY